MINKGEIKTCSDVVGIKEGTVKLPCFSFDTETSLDTCIAITLISNRKVRELLMDEDIEEMFKGKLPIGLTRV